MSFAGKGRRRRHVRVAGSRAAPSGEDGRLIEFKGRRIPETLAAIIDPAHKALVVHELLNDVRARGAPSTRRGGIGSIVPIGLGAEVGLVPTVMHGLNLGYFRVAVAGAIRPTDPARAEDALRHIADWWLVARLGEVTDAWVGKAG